MLTAVSPESKPCRLPMQFLQTTADKENDDPEVSLRKPSLLQSEPARRGLSLKRDRESSLDPAEFSPDFEEEVFVGKVITSSELLAFSSLSKRFRCNGNWDPLQAVDDTEEMVDSMGAEFAEQPPSPSQLDPLQQLESAGSAADPVSCGHLLEDVAEMDAANTSSEYLDVVPEPLQDAISAAFELCAPVVLGDMMQREAACVIQRCWCLHRLRRGLTLHDFRSAVVVMQRLVRRWFRRRLAACLVLQRTWRRLRSRRAKTTKDSRVVSIRKRILEAIGRSADPLSKAPKIASPPRQRCPAASPGAERAATDVQPQHVQSRAEELRKKREELQRLREERRRLKDGKDRPFDNSDAAESSAPASALLEPERSQGRDSADAHSISEPLSETAGDKGFLPSRALAPPGRRVLWMADQELTQTAVFQGGWPANCLGGAPADDEHRRFYMRKPDAAGVLRIRERVDAASLPVQCFQTCSEKQLDDHTLANTLLNKHLKFLNERVTFLMPTFPEDRHFVMKVRADLFSQPEGQ